MFDMPSLRVEGEIFDVAWNDDSNVCVKAYDIYGWLVSSEEG